MQALVDSKCLLDKSVYHQTGMYSALDERQARLGITECVSHNLVIPYPVLFEKPTEFIAQFKTTVFVTNKLKLLVSNSPPWSLWILKIVKPFSFLNPFAKLEKRFRRFIF